MSLSRLSQSRHGNRSSTRLSSAERERDQTSPGSSRKSAASSTQQDASDINANVVHASTSTLYSLKRSPVYIFKDSDHSDDPPLPALPHSAADVPYVPPLPPLRLESLARPPSLSRTGSGPLNSPARSLTPPDSSPSSVRSLHSAKRSSMPHIPSFKLPLADTARQQHTVSSGERSPSTGTCTPTGTPTSESGGSGRRLSILESTLHEKEALYVKKLERMKDMLERIELNVAESEHRIALTQRSVASLRDEIAHSHAEMARLQSATPTLRAQIADKEVRVQQLEADVAKRSASSRTEVAKLLKHVRECNDEERSAHALFAAAIIKERNVEARAAQVGSHVQALEKAEKAGVSLAREARRQVRDSETRLSELESLLEEAKIKQRRADVVLHGRLLHELSALAANKKASDNAEESFDSLEDENARLSEGAQKVFALGKYYSKVPAVARLLKYLFDNSHILAEAISHATSHDDMAVLMKAFLPLFTMGGNILALLRSGIRNHIASTTKETLFRQNSGPTRMFSQFARIVAEDYLRKALLPTFLYLLENPIATEIDVSKDPSVDVSANSFHLASITARLLEDIFDNRDAMPRELRDIYHFVYSEVNLHHGKEAAHYSVGSFLFLRLLGPSIIAPDQLMPSHKIPSTMRRTLVLVSKVLQALVYGSAMAEGYMATMASFIEENRVKIERLFDQLIKPGGPALSMSQDEQIYPALVALHAHLLKIQQPLLNQLDTFAYKEYYENVGRIMHVLERMQQLRIFVDEGKNFPSGKVFCVVRLGSEERTTALSKDAIWQESFVFNILEQTPPPHVLHVECFKKRKKKDAHTLIGRAQVLFESAVNPGKSWHLVTPEFHSPRGMRSPKVSSTPLISLDVRLGSLKSSRIRGRSNSSPRLSGSSSEEHSPKQTRLSDERERTTSVSSSNSPLALSPARARVQSDEAEPPVREDRAKARAELRESRKSRRTRETDAQQSPDGERRHSRHLTESDKAVRTRHSSPRDVAGSLSHSARHRKYTPRDESKKLSDSRSRDESKKLSDSRSRDESKKLSDSRSRTRKKSPESERDRTMLPTAAEKQ